MLSQMHTWQDPSLSEITWTKWSQTLLTLDQISKVFPTQSETNSSGEQVGSVREKYENESSSTKESYLFKIPCAIAREMKTPHGHLMDTVFPHAKASNHTIWYGVLKPYDAPSKCNKSEVSVHFRLIQIDNNIRLAIKRCKEQEKSELGLGESDEIDMPNLDDCVQIVSIRRHKHSITQGPALKITCNIKTKGLSGYKKCILTCTGEIIAKL